jgi:hypothetical protein
VLFSQNKPAPAISHQPSAVLLSQNKACSHLANLKDQRTFVKLLSGFIRSTRRLIFALTKQEREMPVPWNVHGATNRMLRLSSSCVDWINVDFDWIAAFLPGDLCAREQE